MRFHRLTVLGVAALLSSNGFCVINANTGFYVGGDFVVDHYERPEGAAVGGLFNLPGGVLRPIVGYRFNDYLALEAGYSDIENENRNGNAYWGPDRLRIYSYDLSGKAILPFQSGFSLFAKGGLALTHQYVYNVVYAGGKPIANDTTNRIQPLVGAGMSYNITKNLATEFYASYNFPSGSIGGIEMIGLGVTYTFGYL